MNAHPWAIGRIARDFWSHPGLRAAIALQSPRKTRATTAFMKARNELVKDWDACAQGAARDFRRAEARLLEALQRIDRERAYRDLGYPSLMAYAVRGLRLSEATALNFINVARKAVTVPELKREIEAGELSLAMARKIVPVVTPENQAAWIEKAKSLTTRELEKEVARIRPEAATPERIRYVSESRVAVSLGLDEAALQVVRRVQDLESQRLRRAASLEEAIKAMGQAYLEKHDPVKRAERAQARAERTETRVERPEVKSGAEPKGEPARSKAPDQGSASQESTDADAPVAGHAPRERIEAALRHQVSWRDGAQCSYLDANGARCGQRRWLDIHHLVSVAQGGRNELENLVTLCAGHHRLTHHDKSIQFFYPSATRTKPA
jgi:hypothetical protein